MPPGYTRATLKFQLDLVTYPDQVRIESIAIGKIIRRCRVIELSAGNAIVISKLDLGEWLCI